MEYGNSTRLWTLILTKFLALFSTLLFHWVTAAESRLTFPTMHKAFMRPHPGDRGHGACTLGTGDMGLVCETVTLERSLETPHSQRSCSSAFSLETSHTKAGKMSQDDLGNLGNPSTIPQTHTEVQRGNPPQHCPLASRSPPCTACACLQHIAHTNG